MTAPPPPILDYAPPPPKSTLCLLSLLSLILGILALIWCFLLHDGASREALVPALAAILLGILAWRNISRSRGRQHSRGYALCGIVLGGLAFLNGLNDILGFGRFL